MISMRDIYSKVDLAIVQAGFWDVSFDEKKKLIDNELKNYIILKLDELKECPKDATDFSVVELFAMLSSKIPKRDHFETLRHFIHYILQVASSLQNYYIIWESDCDQENKNNPYAEFNLDGLWISLITCIPDEKVDYVNLFAFVYDVFINRFMIQEQLTN